MYMIITDLFDIDIHIFTVIKFLFNFVVKFKYILLKKFAKIKFEKIPGSTEFRDLTASTWVNTTCRDIQTAIIKTCAYNNRSALKLAFGEEYDKLYPGSIYSPPSYNENFSSSEG